jgi:hypothetical protein
VLYAYHSDINCILKLIGSGFNYEGCCSGTSLGIVLAALVDAINGSSNGH